MNGTRTYISYMDYYCRDDFEYLYQSVGVCVCVSLDRMWACENERKRPSKIANWNYVGVRACLRFSSIVLEIAGIPGKWEIKFATTRVWKTCLRLDGTCRNECIMLYYIYYSLLWSSSRCLFIFLLLLYNSMDFTFISRCRYYLGISNVFMYTYKYVQRSFTIWIRTYVYCH